MLRAGNGQTADSVHNGVDIKSIANRYYLGSILLAPPILVQWNFFYFLWYFLHIPQLSFHSEIQHIWGTCAGKESSTYRSARKQLFSKVACV